jgi:thiol-disulfide isomerase/thioredoxin
MVFWPTASARAQSARGAQIPFLGVRMTATPSGAVRLAGVLPGSPAASAGLQRGDLLAGIAGRTMSAPRDVAQAIATARVGDSLAFTVLRMGQHLDLTVRVGASPPPSHLLQSFVGRPAPAWRLPRQGGAPLALSSLRGRVVLLYFWSLWCGACRMATPALESWAQQYGRQGLEVVVVSSDPAAALAARPSAINLPLVRDPEGKMGAEYWVSAFPSFFVIDRSGTVTLVQEGWAPDQGRALETAIRRGLSASP